MANELHRPRKTKISASRARSYAQQLLEYVKDLERLRDNRRLLSNSLDKIKEERKRFPISPTRRQIYGTGHNTARKKPAKDPRTIEVSCELPIFYSRHRWQAVVIDGRAAAQNTGRDGPVDHMDYFQDAILPRDYGIRFFCPGFFPTPLKDIPA